MYFSLFYSLSGFLPCACITVIILKRNVTKKSNYTWRYWYKSYLQMWHWVTWYFLFLSEYPSPQTQGKRKIFSKSPHTLPLANFLWNRNNMNSKGFSKYKVLCPCLGKSQKDKPAASATWNWASPPSVIFLLLSKDHPPNVYTYTHITIDRSTTLLPTLPHWPWAQVVLLGLILGMWGNDHRNKS